jgi:hypothetical protein
MSGQEKDPPIPAGIPAHVVAVAEGMRLLGRIDRRRLDRDREWAIAQLGGKRAA